MLHGRRAFLHQVLLCSLAQADQQSELRRLAPPDGGDSDPELDTFVGNLLSLVRARDAAALSRLMLPAFRVDFDFGKGPAAFARRWAHRSHESPVWLLMERILAMPGVRLSPTLYAAPYVVARFPLDLELLSHVAATSPAAPILPLDNPQAPPLFTVDHAILPLAKPLLPPVLPLPGAFLELALPGHPPCCVSTDYAYSPAGYRLFLEKQRGRWGWISLACATMDYPPDLQRLEQGRRKLAP